jgi:hypothetical protein
MSVPTMTGQAKRSSQDCEPRSPTHAYGATRSAPDTPRYEEQDLDMLMHDLDRSRVRNEVTYRKVRLTVPTYFISVDVNPTRFRRPASRFTRSVREGTSQRLSCLDYSAPRVLIDI